MVKTISKICFFVISLLFLSFSVASCSSDFFGGADVDPAPRKNISKVFDQPQIVGTIQSSEISESSGLVMSRCNKNVLWTHNDSKNGPFIFALNEKGKKLGTWKVGRAENRDWEDIATIKTADGKCFLYIGDIGNNMRDRSEMTVYRLEEPIVSEKAQDSSIEKPQRTSDAEALNFSYPDFRHDAETLLVNQQTEEIYVITKRLSGSAGVYKLVKKSGGEKLSLRKVSDFNVPALPNGYLTGGEISPDGTRVVVCDYYNAYEISIPEDEKDFDRIWMEEPAIIELGKREQGEAICYSVDMRSIFATSEKRDSPLIKVTRK